MKTVVVIGGGIAGLAAAQALQSYPFRVLLLEARSRLGGRIATDHRLGYPVDLGASFIHGLEHNPIAHLVEHYALAKQVVNFQSIPLVESYWHDSTEYQAYPKVFMNLLEEAKQLALSFPEDCTLQDSLQFILQQRHDSLKMKTLLTWRASIFRGRFAADLKRVSARYWDSECRLDGGNHLLLPGHSVLIDKLSKGIAIHLKTIVSKIDYQHQQIRITTNHGVLRADNVICTVPLAVLQNEVIQFIPALPVIKQQALNHLQMGDFNKVMLHFPHVFWPKDLLFSSIVHHQEIGFFINYQTLLGQPALLALIAGDAAKHLECLRQEETIEIIVQVLKKCFGNKIPAPINSITTRWRTDPYSRGAYTYLPPGSNPEQLHALSLPIANKLFFAGEATHQNYYATTQGAYLSGQRAANEVAMALT